MGARFEDWPHLDVCFLHVVGSGATVDTLGTGYPYLPGCLSPKDQVVILTID
jgi:hypothetical protein